MGKVYLAVHPGIGRQAAVKVLSPGDAADPQIVSRFITEARAANAIRHPNIVDIYDSGVLESGTPYIVMEYLEGEMLTQALARGPVPLADVIDWGHKEGIYAILDMHAAPGGQTGMNIDDSYGRPFLFDDPAAQELTIRLWTEIARRFAGENAVLGYNLLNEPMADFFDEKAYFPRLEPFFRRVIAGIRTVDPGHIIILGGGPLGQGHRHPAPAARAQRGLHVSPL